jgi:hypothetical protein
MLAAAMATSANSVMRLRTDARDALEVSNCVSRFMFRTPSKVGQTTKPPRRNLADRHDDNMTFVETRDDDRACCTIVIPA